MPQLSEPMAELLRGNWQDHWPLLVGLLVLFCAEAGVALALVEVLAPTGAGPDLATTAIYPGLLTLGLTIRAYVLERAGDERTAFFMRILRDFYAAGVLFALLLSGIGASAL